MDYFSFGFPSSYPFTITPLFPNWTNLCLLIRVDSQGMIVTHPRILVLGPGGYAMTHGLTS